jgi:hypothetical protein
MTASSFVFEVTLLAKGIMPAPRARRPFIPTESTVARPAELSHRSQNNYAVTFFGMDQIACFAGSMNGR